VWRGGGGGGRGRCCAKNKIYIYMHTQTHINLCFSGTEISMPNFREVIEGTEKIKIYCQENIRQTCVFAVTLTI